MLFIRSCFQLSAIYRKSITLCAFPNLTSESLIFNRNLDICRELDFSRRLMKCSAQCIHQTSPKITENYSFRLSYVKKPIEFCPIYEINSTWRWMLAINETSI